MRLATLHLADDAYYRSHLKNNNLHGGTADNDRQPEVLVCTDSQYGTGNSRFVEHEYSYIADLQAPPTSASGAPDGQTAAAEEGVEGQVDELVGVLMGQSLVGSGQGRVCRPVAECAAQQCRQA